MISTQKQTPLSGQTEEGHYSIEFFHIYTDEIINQWHQQSLEIMKSLQTGWDFNYRKIVLIDDYNPTETNITVEDILAHLNDNDMLPDFWAFEGDMLENAKVFLDTLPPSKLKKNYQRYIKKNGKYPCSLLTATWYLTRLGRLDGGMIKSTNSALFKTYPPATRLFNLLPEVYKPVERRAKELIFKSPFSTDVDRIQDLFYPTEDVRALDLF